MLIGRPAADEALDHLIDAIASGTGGALVLDGEVGSGRTQGLEHAAARASERDIVVLAARGRAEGVDVGAVLHHSLDRIAPRPAGRNEHDESSLVERLTEAAVSSPVLVTIDDADLLDRDARCTLLTCVDALAASAVGFLLVDRIDRPRLSGLSRITFGPLDHASFREIVAGEIDIDPAVAAALHRLTNGNPGMGLATARSLSDPQRHGLERLPTVARTADGMAEHLAGRLAGLGDRTRHALAVAAAVPDGQVRVVQRALARLDADPAALDAAEAAGVVRVADGQYHFDHPGLRSLAYHALAPASRRAAHRAIAWSLDRPHEAELRAWQLVDAADGPDAMVAEALDLVADAAVSRGAPLEAARARLRAAQMSDASASREHRLRLAADHFATAFHPVGLADVADLLAAGRTSGPELVDAVLMQGLGLRWTEGPWAAGAHLAERAASLDPVDGHALWIAAADECLDAGAPTEALRALDRIEPGDPLAALLAEVAGVAAVPEGRDAPLKAWSMADRVVRRRAERTDGSDHDTPCATTGSHRLETTAALARRTLRHGAVTEAHDVVDAELRDDSGPAFGRAACLLVRAEADLIGGRTTAADRAITRAERLAASVRGRPLVGAAHHLRAVACLAHADPAGALEVLDAAPSGCFDDPRLRAEIASDRLEAQIAARHATRDVAAVEALVDHPDRRVAGRARRAVRAHQAAGSTDDAAALLTGLPLELARLAVVAGELDAAAGWLAAIDARGWTIPEAPSTDEDPLHVLTAAERRVALTVGRDGQTNKETAATLFVSAKTVDSHLQSIYRKLGIRSRSELAIAMAGSPSRQESVR